jgi:hypothetical protein
MGLGHLSPRLVPRPARHRRFRVRHLAPLLGKSLGAAAGGTAGSMGRPGRDLRRLRTGEVPGLVAPAELSSRDLGPAPLPRLPSMSSCWSRGWLTSGQADLGWSRGSADTRSAAERVLGSVVRAEIIAAIRALSAHRVPGGREGSELPADHDLTGMPPGTVKSSRYRARRQVRAGLAARLRFGTKDPGGIAFRPCAEDRAARQPGGCIRDVEPKGITDERLRLWQQWRAG